jgi:hypothetical protein
MALIFVVHNYVLPESIEQDSDLEGPCGYDVVKADGAPRVTFKENHQEAKAHEDHYMNILERWILVPNILCHFHIFLDSGLRSSSIPEIGKETKE